MDGWHSWPIRRSATLRAIEDLDADVIGLQEVRGFQLRWLERRLPDYVACSGSGRNGGRRGELCPVFVRHGFAASRDVRTRWFGATPDVAGSRLLGASHPRIVVLTELEVSATGQLLQIANTHLDAASRSNRRSSATQLLGWLDPDLAHVVVGDLNASPTEESVRLLLQSGLRPALEPGDGGTAHRFRGGRDGPQIDHILFSRQWRLVSAGVAAAVSGRLPSDHWPVCAELVLDGAASLSQRPQPARP